MLGWLYRLLVGNFKGCKHEWEILREYRRAGSRSDTSGGCGYVLKCKHCGDMKQKDFY